MLTLRLTLVALFAALPALAQNLAVIPVPVVSNDANAPHAAYNGHATTFKAIARGGDGSYLVEWDFQGDGTFDTSSTITNRYDLSARFTYPNVTADADYAAVVRVTSNTETVTATYRVHVFANVPVDPNLADARQLQVMRAVVIDDTLWFLHTQLNRSGNEAHPLTGAQATATMSGPEPILAEGEFLEALGRNGHFIAFPPAYLGAMRDPVGNAQRYALDPYAEDIFRLVNQELGRLSIVNVSTNPGNNQGSPNDESNATGFYPEVVANPIPGTDDGFGFQVGSNMYTGYQAAVLRGFASVRLGGYSAQVGDSIRVLNRPLPFVIQQMVDAAVWAQNDGGSYPGSYWYGANSNSDMMAEYLAGGLNVAEALWWVEQTMTSEGVIVPNIMKARFVTYLVLAAKNCPAGGIGTTYFASGASCDFPQSAAYTMGLGWVGAHQFSATDSRPAFPGYPTNANPTRGLLRASFDSNQTFIGAVFLTGVLGSQGWDHGLVLNGDFSRIDGQFDLWNMIHWARAARAVEPEVTTFGPHDWERQFSRVVVNHQAANGGVNWAFSSLQSNNDNIVGANGRAVWAVLVVSPDVQRPIAVVKASPSPVAEGTAVSITSTALVHDAPAWSWTLGNGATNTGSAFSYAWPDDGTFTVTGTATTTGGTSSHSTTVTVTNVAPSPNAGADVTVAEGTPTSFVGSFSDPGTADTHTTTWQFGDGQSANALSTAHTYADNGVFTAVLRVTDDDMGMATDSVQVTVTNVAPTITSTPPLVAVVGRAFTYTLTYTDPGTTDVHTCSGTPPAGATFTNCTLSWTPTAAQAGAISLSLCVSDDDAGQTCQAFQVTVIPAAANQLPSAPGIDSPNATQVATLQPTLTVSNASDPENDPLTYEFEVFQGTTRVANQSNVTEGPGTTAWPVNVMLTEGAAYTWRARAVSAGGASPWSSVATFSVNVTNLAPPPPTLLSPAPDAVVSSAQPTLVFLPWPDPDGDALTFDWQLAADESFTTPLEMGTGVTTTQLVVTSALTEDARFCWRVRASDGQTQSAWSRACFRVSAVDGAPSVPTLLAPAASANVNTLQPVFAWTASVDPEGEALTYELELSEGATPVANVMGLGGTATVIAQSLVDGRTYSWRVRAKAGAAMSAFTAPSEFTVVLPRIPDAGAMGGGAGGGAATGGGGAATGGGGGAAGGGGATGGGGGGDPKPGCGCTSAAGGELALLGLALAAWRRRQLSRRSRGPIPGPSR